MAQGPARDDGGDVLGCVFFSSACIIRIGGRYGDCDPRVRAPGRSVKFSITTRPSPVVSAAAAASTTTRVRAGFSGFLAAVWL